MIKAKKKPIKKKTKTKAKPKQLSWSGKFTRSETGLAKHRRFSSRCGLYSVEEVRSKVLLAKGKPVVYWQSFCHNDKGWVVRLRGEAETMAEAKQLCLDHYQKP